MIDLPDALDFDKGDLIDYGKNVESQVRENTPTTVILSCGGTILGAVAFGPAGGVVGSAI